MDNLIFRPVRFGRVADYIEKTIKESILSAELKAGDKLPTEKELASQFGVSMVTLREALRSLQVMGLIEKRRGMEEEFLSRRLMRNPLKPHWGISSALKICPSNIFTRQEWSLSPPAVDWRSRE
jgi:DNA-binding transcriptional MocR family regulator